MARKLFVPGRICLFGEHSDWAGGYRRLNPALEKGYTLICGTDQGIYADVEPHPSDLVITATTPRGEVLGPVEIPMEPQALLAEARQGTFWSYVAGVAWQAHTHYRVQGLVIDNHFTDLPIKKGLSSSAAICVLAARAFNQVYDLKLTTRGEMELAYQGEVTTPSRCGRMDQGCAFGNCPVLMTFDGDLLDTVALKVGADLHFVVVDLQAQKNTMKILEQLNRCYPQAETEVARGVQELLGPVNRQITRQAVAALEAGDARCLGSLMAEAQALFDHYAMPACREELAAPVLHRVLGYEPLRPHVWGGKGVGSQGDGAAQFVARSAADQQAAVEMIERDLAMPCFRVTLRAEGLTYRPVRSTVVRSGPVRKVRKAVIPVAGLGTRLFPATMAVKKEMFPVVDRDGLAKPAILLIVEEALAAGIEEVILVVRENDVEVFHTLFGGRAPGGYPKLPPEQEVHARRLRDMGRRVTFALQTTQDGFGHAVYAAQEAVGGEPFLLMLGDHLYRSRNSRSCARQLLDTYEREGYSVLGLRLVGEDQVRHYGVATGTWREEGRLLQLDTLLEKPSVELARASLLTPGLAPGEYLAFFGQYVVRPELFDHLADEITNGQRERGEFQLTPALARLCREHGFLGLLLEGDCYDIGLPQAYLHTLQAFSQ